MKDSEYRTILKAIEESLRLLGDDAPESGTTARIYKELRKVRETLIRVQRDSMDKNVKRPDSRSPLGIP
jgi:hypothetical protein